MASACCAVSPGSARSSCAPTRLSLILVVIYCLHATPWLDAVAAALHVSCAVSCPDQVGVGEHDPGHVSEYSDWLTRNGDRRAAFAAPSAVSRKFRPGSRLA